MAAAMCTLIPHHHEFEALEEQQQPTMDPIQSRSIDVADYAQTSATDPAFMRLPDEIIEQILRFTDANSFASLILLNKRWRQISQSPQLYAHHLSGCRSFSASHDAVSSFLIDEDLPRLRNLFAQEVKRNLFDCYLRPRETLINLVSTSISSSAAFPGGEAFHFSFSPNGHYVLAYSSSRIYVLDVAAEDVAVKRELKIMRRPSTATILDDGSMLALLSTDHQVDLYDISKHDEKPKHIKVVVLDHSPRTIALSPDGSILAIGYEGGVEVYSLATTALPTDRRAVKCDPSDSISFSPDGTQLLGTTLHSSNPSTVILTAPYYNPVSQLPEESISQLWTTSILFPNSSRDCSHAALLPSVSENDSSWTFTYDKVFETFRAVRIDDLRNGTTYFTGPRGDSSFKLLPSTLPTANRKGEIVAAGFQSRQIWLYGVPEDLDAAPEIVQNLSGNGDSMISTPTSDRRTSAIAQEPSANRVPQWQTLADRFRNTFVEGRNVADLEGSKAMRWVSERQGYHTERLVVVAPGIVGQTHENEDDSLVPVDGGRLLLLDFKYDVKNGEKRTLTIEVGNAEPEVLEEEQRDMDAEVAIVRRRTIAARRRTTANVGNLGTVTVPSLPVPSAPAANNSKSPSYTEAEAAERLRNIQLSGEENASVADEEEVFDAPYSHTSPRSGNTLRRAATVVANHRRLNPRVLVSEERVGMRRTDGTELPHESDADNWQPPPPPYSREPIDPLPEHLRNAILNGRVRTTLNSSSPQPSPRLAFGIPTNGQGTSLHRSRSANSARPSLQRSVSDDVTVASRDFRDIMISRPSSTPSFLDDIYGVSPPASPRVPTRAAEPVSPETDELSSSSPNPVSGNTTEPQAQLLMRATLLQPVSPIPQPVQAWERASTAQRLEDWESTNHTSQPSPSIDVEEPVQSVTSDRLQAPVPPRPNEDHHMTSFNNSPIPSEHETEIETTESGSDITQQLYESANQPLQSESVSVIRNTLQSPIFYEGGLERPSDDQIKSLNNRSGRPPARILTDPSRRRSGSGSSIYEAPGNSSPRHSNSGNRFNLDPSNPNISEENEPPSSPSGRNRSGSGSSTTRASRVNMPPISLDMRQGSWAVPSSGPQLTNLCELGTSNTRDNNSDLPSENIDINNAISNFATELPVFAPQPTRPTYPTHADRRNSGYSTPPRVNTPPRSVNNSPSSSPRSNNIQTQNGRQSPIRRRPVTTYNTYTNTTFSNSTTNRRHSGLAYELSSSSTPNLPRTTSTDRNIAAASARLQGQTSNPNFSSNSLVRLDTIRSVGAASVDDLDGKRNRMKSGFRNWGRGRSRNGPAVTASSGNGNIRKRETADWSELLGDGGGEGLRLGVGVRRDRSKSGDRLSVLGGGVRSDRAVSKENKKRRQKKGGGMKCVVM